MRPTPTTPRFSIRSKVLAGIAVICVSCCAAAYACAYALLVVGSRLEVARAAVGDGAAAAALASAGHAVGQATGTIFVCGLVCVGLGVAVGLWMSARLARPLREARLSLERMADGDLTARVSYAGHDELGDMAESLDKAQGGLSRTLERVKSASRQIDGIAGRLGQASSELASGAAAQAESHESTAASLEQLTVTVRQNADRAAEASRHTDDACARAERSSQVVGRAVEAMNGVHEASRRIAEINSTIDEIAFQTNLLALNAAVEAARAGEHGRGFAVVAGEVRGLAQRSAGAAREIKVLVQDTATRVDTGVALVNQSGEALGGIVNSVRSVSGIVAGIAAASREQSAGIDLVNEAVARMDGLTNTGLAKSRELAETADSLTAQAHALLGLVQDFDTGGRRAGEPGEGARRAA